MSDFTFFRNFFHAICILKSFNSHISFVVIEEKNLRKTLLIKVKLLKMSNFTFFHNIFYAICILKSFNSHISCRLQLLWIWESQNGVLGNGLISYTLKCNSHVNQGFLVPLANDVLHYAVDLGFNKTTKLKTNFAILKAYANKHLPLCRNSRKCWLPVFSGFPICWKKPSSSTIVKS